MRDGINRLKTTPLKPERTVRGHNLSVLTSMQPGLCVPVAVMPLLREDSMRGSVNVEVEMMEAHELILNRVNMRVTAYLVPKLAFDRFEGSRDQLDRSYMGQPKVDGGAVVPYFETSVLAAEAGNNPLYKAMGLHGKIGDTINSDYLEAYNQIINMRLRNRSPNLTKRARLDNTFAPAFWLNSQWQHVVPDFDQATMDGEVALQLASNRINIRGISTPPTAVAAGTVLTRNIDGTTFAAPSGTEFPLHANKTVAGQPSAVWAELIDGGATISLSDLANAKKAQWYAKAREAYQGIVDGNVLDEYIIDMAMQGLELPDQAYKYPILLADVVTQFSQAKRYASDYANMAESAVSGAARASFDLVVPRCPVGGVVMIMVECLPDQLFERQRDPYQYLTSVAELPDAMRDDLDTQKVDIVKNGQVDVDHATPNGTFGYEPMNGKWNRFGPRIGGKFRRPAAGAGNDAVRERIWAVETLNPTLGTSFYLCPPFNLKPFLDTVSDPFEVAVGGMARIEGNTQFGGVLVEQTNLYQKVVAKIPTPASQAKPL